ncbi:hypothetical protein FB567DRAFT_69870 [Paraphoma chrysanthemicola]|uniref:Rhodopsin domain-containing protein n=1 Tax=Paraphoma chrysanthemicola TaxID=798071 RepID=A0A8K0R3M4_9PLEO|nr:hypothetical protein FB567DRAFT_69870 [Paraphoma chrysanthemicola]
MAKCDPTEQHLNALITAHNHGIILLMVAWFLACLLALCTAIRIKSRFRSQRLQDLPLSDDVIVVAASLCGLGATISISTAVDSGLGKKSCFLTSADLDQVQVKVFISTILVVLALSISKCSILLFLSHVAGTTLQRLGVLIIGIMVMVWTLAVMAGIIFECAMPRPWEIWTGKCIPMLPFWITATAVDIVIDITLVSLSAHMVWTSQLDFHGKALAFLIFSLRLVLIAASCIRLVYLERALSPAPDPAFSYIPYAITTQCHSTLTVIISCMSALKPLNNLLRAGRVSHTSKKRHSKHWSGTTIGGAPYESYTSFGTSSTHIIKEPLQSIQRSMSTPTSPAASRSSLHPTEDVLLPEVLMPKRYAKAPPRPPPPRDEERPDLSMFTRKTMFREPPSVTRLGSVREKVWERASRDTSLTARGVA